MRTRPNLQYAEDRFANRYHKLYEPLIDLIQALEDLLPQGFQLGEEIDLTVHDGMISIKGGSRPARLIVHDAKHQYILEVRNNPSARKQTAVD
jgi:hypothetical protein